MSIPFVVLTSLGVSSGTPISPSAIPIDIPPVFGQTLLNCFTLALSYQLLSYFATIFACAWVTVHPDVPHPRDSVWTRFKRQTTTFLYALLLPEFAFGWAWHERKAAIKAMQEYNALFHADVVIVQRSWLANIRHDIKGWFNGPDSAKPNIWTVAHGFLVGMGGFVLYDGNTPLHTLTFNMLKTLIKEGKVDPPEITEAEIYDKSKSDLLSKMLLLQPAWFIVHCATKPMINQLDAAILTFVVLNAITFFLWWMKPQNVRLATAVTLKGPELGRGKQKIQVGGRKAEAIDEKAQ